MKKLFFLTLLLPGLFFFNNQDKLSTKKGNVSFASPAEDHADIKAVSHTASCSIDKKSGEIDFTVTVNDFKFEKEGLQEIFSKQIMNSDQYPTAGFKGIITDRHIVDFTKNGDYLVVAKGTLTLHGVTKDLQTQCVLKVKDNTVQATAEFQLNMKDFKIENPITNDTIKITIDCLLEHS